jgi:hypothetical protein
MAKKIITSIIVLIIIGFGIYFGVSKFSGYKLKADISGIETPEMAIPFDSGLTELELSNFDMGVSLSSDLFGNIFIETDLSGEAAELQAPDISISAGTPSVQTGTPPTGWQPDAATCNQFKSAPSCMFVPEQYRDMCEQCKALGY